MKRFTRMSLLVTVLGYGIGNLLLHNTTWRVEARDIIEVCLIYGFVALSQLCGLILGIIAASVPEKPTILAFGSVALPIVLSATFLSQVHHG